MINNHRKLSNNTIYCSWLHKSFLLFYLGLLGHRPRFRINLKTNQLLFASESNNSSGLRLTTRSISKIAKEGLKSIGLNDRSLTAYSLRHTCAVTIMKSGLPLESAQALLRHKNSSTTQIYLATIEKELRLQDSTELILNNLFLDRNEE